MIARVLPKAQWPADHEPPPLLKFIPEDEIAMVVVQDGKGKIVARWYVFQATHFEGLWIDPEFRGNAGVIRPLLRQAYALPLMRGERWAFSGAAIGSDGTFDDKVDYLLQRLGGQLQPVRTYVVPVGPKMEH